jgi:hypothetical protein
MKRTILILLFAVMMPPQASCQESEPIAPAGMIRYAEHLASRGQFREAAEEYARTLSYFPSLNTRLDLFNAAFFLANSAKDPDYALSFVQKTAALGSGLDLQCLTQVYRGRIFYGMRHYPEALQALALEPSCRAEQKANSLLKKPSFLRFSA